MEAFKESIFQALNWCTQNVASNCPSGDKTTKGAAGLGLSLLHVAPIDSGSCIYGQCVH